MIQELANISQQQFILILGIIIVVLLLLDAYRRIKRKKYKVMQNAQTEVDKPKASTSDIAPKKENISNAKLIDETKSDNAPAEIISASENEKKIENVEMEYSNLKGEENKNDDSQLDALNKIAEDEEVSASSTWQEALLLKQKQQVEDRQKIQEDQIADDANRPETPSLKQGIISLHIMAPRTYVFYGEDLKTVFDHYQLNYSQEFKSFQGISEDSEVLFNIMTATNPGIFNLNNIEALQAPGISIFMDIASLSNPRESFKQMLSLLYKITENLGGTLLNESRSRFTQSDVSRITASIRNFESSS
ncbi:MAG: cell division protein ZipA [Francisellaceae bacterium]|jgi:cell division protein ZipA